MVQITEQRMGFQGAIRIFNVNRQDSTNRTLFLDFMFAFNFMKGLFPNLESAQPLYEFNPIGSKVTVIAFAKDSTTVITGHESGKLALWDVRKGEEILTKERAHNDFITDLQFSPDRSYLITSSKDKSAKV